MHVPGKQPMGADDHIYLAILQPQNRVCVLGIRAKTAGHLDPHGIPVEPRSETLIMLLGQHGGWNEHGHLAPERVVDRDVVVPSRRRVTDRRVLPDSIKVSDAPSKAGSSATTGYATPSGACAGSRLTPKA